MNKFTAKLLAFLLAFTTPANAQWQVPNGSVPIGHGPGVIGFSSIAPGASGNCLVSNGSIWTSGICGFDNTQLAKTANYTVTNNDNSRNFALSGNTLFTLTFNDPATITAGFRVTIKNRDSILTGGRGKIIAIFGQPYCMLYPGEMLIVERPGTTWEADCPTSWRPPVGANIVFYTNFNTGTDDNTVTDGLAAAAPFKTASFGLYNAYDRVYARGAQTGQTSITVRMADNVTDTTKVHYSDRSRVVGSQGGFTLTLEGGTASVLSVTGDATVNIFFAIIRLKDLYLVSDTECLGANFGSQVYLDNVKFRSCGDNAVTVVDQSRVIQSGVVYFSDAAPATETYGIIAQRGGEYNDAGFGISFISDTTFTAIFLLCQSNGLVFVSGLVDPSGHTLAGQAYRSDTSCTMATSVLPVAFSAGVKTQGGTYNGSL